MILAVDPRATQLDCGVKYPDRCHFRAVTFVIDAIDGEMPICAWHVQYYGDTLEGQMICRNCSKLIVRCELGTESCGLTGFRHATSTLHICDPADLIPALQDGPLRVAEPDPEFSTSPQPVASQPERHDQ